MSTLALERVTIDGYDLTAERQRYQFQDVKGRGVSLNRGTAKVGIKGDMENSRYQAGREAHNSRMFLTTHDDTGPVVELGYPTAGHYVSCSEGVYLDMMLGVAQKLFDDNHPALREQVAILLERGLLLRREINTDDYLITAEDDEQLRTPQDLAELLHTATSSRFQSRDGWKSFFCNSGAEAIEAAIKLAMLVKWRRLEERYGKRNVERLMDQLGIKKNEILESRDTTRDEPVYRDYPMFLVATAGAFHGRTLGALNLTQSKKAHQIGYQKLQWVRHVEYNKDSAALARLIDARPLDQILDGEGVKAVLDRGKIPADLCAAFIAEGFQGEGGYVPGDPDWFRGIARAAKEHAILLIADEVQTLGRTGKLYAWEHLGGVQPDVIAMAKSAYLGIMIARGEYRRSLHGGWHSNTWGGGKILDVNIAWATLDTLLHHKPQHLDGLSHFENEEIKGKYLRQLVEKVKSRHPETIVGISGRGVMNGLEVRKRDALIRVGWQRGLKLLGAGLAKETGKIRLLCLADVTTKEIEDFARALDDVCAAVERGE